MHVELGPMADRLIIATSSCLFAEGELSGIPCKGCCVPLLRNLTQAPLDHNLFFFSPNVPASEPLFYVLPKRLADLLSTWDEFGATIYLLAYGNQIKYQGLQGSAAEHEWRQL